MKKILSLILVTALLLAAAGTLNAPAFAEGLEGSGDTGMVDPGTGSGETPTYPGIMGGEIGGGSDPTDPPSGGETNPTEAPTNPSYDPVVPTVPVDPTLPTVPTTPTLPVNTGYPVITKHPTSETVRDGGYAEFVARADNCQEIQWYMSNERTGAEFLVWQAPDRFPGLIATGVGGERLGLNHIPYIMDGWRVRAKFIGTEGEVYSNYADIYVKPADLKEPTITQQPRSVSLKENEAVNLEVTAMSPDPGTRLTYQWYMNTTDSNVGGKVIYSATSASYVPDYIPGTTYYYCTIRSTDGNTTSQPSKTQAAAVIYSRAVPETTAPTTSPTTAPTVPETSAPQTPIWAEATQETAAPALPTVTAARTGSLLWILIAAIIVIILLGILATVLILKLYPRDDEEEEEEAVAFIPPAPRKKAKAQASDDLADLSALLANDDPEWDDLSDLGDLSIYFDDDNK